MKKFLAGSCLGFAAALGMYQSIANPVMANGAAQRPLVYDATGKAAGRYGEQGFWEVGFAILQIEDALLRVNLKRASQGESVDSSSLRWDESRLTMMRYVPWSSSDCSGVAFIAVEYSTGADIGFPAAAFVRDPSGNLMAYIAAEGEASNQSPQSVQDTETGACLQQAGIVNGWPADKIVNLTARHPEPLTVRFAIR